MDPGLRHGHLSDVPKHQEELADESGEVLKGVINEHAEVSHKQIAKAKKIFRLESTLTKVEVRKLIQTKVGGCKREL